MRLRRCAAMAALVFGTLVATAVPAWAAAPDNDSYAGRTVVGSLPFSQTLDTNEASTEPADSPLNGLCGDPVTDASVWYEVTAESAGTMLLDFTQSSYTVGAVVASGSPGNWTLADCVLGRGTWQAAAGQTYTILAFDNQWDGGGNGGVLNVSLDWGPPAPTLDMTVDRYGEADPNPGIAKLSGTATCSNAQDAAVSVFLSQPVGRVATISGYGYSGLICDGAAHHWAAEVYPDSGGKFAGGKATLAAYASACGSYDCASDSEQRTVVLRG
jgi:hypothetical protein